MEKQVTITLERNTEKVYPGTVLFSEKQESEFMPEILGGICVQKSALAELHYAGENIAVTIIAGKVKGGIVCNFRKTTANKVAFDEVVASEWDAPKLSKTGIYVPKSTLAGIGYKGGEITVKIAIAK